ncbi:hypothetical protein [Nocardioides ochotonae]|uniref:hypothetical protein n=1 Tax=Nocardioides ochotonae TaxID=2685869 RepID=UPI001407240A|nr:hypothetical protein [Nocardioides ochotonae]
MTVPPARASRRATPFALAAALTLAALGPVGATSATAACTPSFAVDEPGPLVPGETLHLSGSCFAPGQRLAIKMDADSYGQIGADDGEDAPYRTRSRVQVEDDGTFRAEPVVVPRFQPANGVATTSGSHTLHLLDNDPVTTVGATFTVRAEHAATAVVEGEELQISGTGFRDRAGTGGSQVAVLLWSGDEVLTRPAPHAPHADAKFWATGQADASGAFTLTASLPDGGRLGARGSVPSAAGSLEVRVYSGRELTGHARDLTRNLPLTSVEVAPAPALTGDAPRVTGRPSPGGELRASAAFAPAAQQLSHQWLRDGTPIEGATAAAYRPVPGDVGARLSVAVTGEAAGHAPTTLTSREVPVVRGALVRTARPQVRGVARVGRTLRATRGSWSPRASTRVQWLRDGRPITGATRLTRRVAAADRGHTLRVRVTASRPGYATMTARSTGVRVRRG